MTTPPPPGPPGHLGPFGGPGSTGGWNPPAPPARKPWYRNRWLTHGGAAVVALFVGVGIGAGGDTADAAAEADGKPRPTVTVTAPAKAGQAPTARETVTATVTAKAEPAPTVTVTAEPEKTQKSGPADRISGDGEYLVGEDIESGTYKSAGPEGSFGCYWARLENASGEFDAIIANNNLKGPGRVTLNKGEYFKTSRCQEWEKVG